MKNLLTKLRYVPTRFGMVAALLLATVGAAATFAWGPDRPTYTMAQPADHVTFNSITDNPNYGDEREFVIIRDLTTGGSYGDEANLVPGHEYQVQVYVHNNAHPDLNASGKGVAKDTNVRVVVPASVTGSDTVDGFVKASNAAPTEVWDTAELKSTNKVDLEYVSGSAHLSTNSQQVNLPDSILSTGVKIGDKDMSGDWRGCLEYAGAVTFKFRVKEQPTNEFTMDKQVRKHSTTTGGWVENYAAAPGEVVDYIVRYKNTGTMTQENVHVKDVLPVGMTYVAGSTVVANSNYPTGHSVVDGVTAAGINIGAYTPGANAWVRFSAKVAANDSLETCGQNVLKNVASVKTGAGTKSDGADVSVTKTCTTPTPKAECKEIKSNKISRTSFSFDGAATVSGGATVSKYTFVVKNAAGSMVVTKEVTTNALTANSGTVNLPTAGTYSVTLSVTTSQGVKTHANCATTITVTPEDKDIEVCRLSDKQMVTIKESEYNANKDKYSTNPDDCKPVVDEDIEVCRLSDKTIITIKKSEFDATKHSMNPDDCESVVEYVDVCRLSDKQMVRITEAEYNANKDKYSTNPDDCKTLSENYIKVCRLSDKAEITINEKDFDATKHSKVLADCKIETPVTPETPETPETIASTGAGAIVGGLFGSSALGLGISSFVRSRSTLRSALKR